MLARGAGDASRNLPIALPGLVSLSFCMTPRAAGGPTNLDNLALACVSCSLRKWAKRMAADPDTGEEAPLYSPREQVWNDHFRWDGPRVVPLTATGRATVSALAMNRPLAVAIRLEEAARRRHPAP